FSSRRRHTRCLSDWSSDVCSSDLRSRDQKSLTDGHVVSRRPPLVAGRERGNPARLGRRIDLLSLVVTTYLAECAIVRGPARAVRSEERRVGKEWSFQWRG